MFKVTQFVGSYTREYTCGTYAWSGSRLTMWDVEGYITAGKVNLSLARGEIVGPTEIIEGWDDIVREAHARICKGLRVTFHS